MKFVMSCTGFKPRKPIFKKVDFRNISKKLKFDEDSNMTRIFGKSPLLWHEILPLPFAPHQ